MENNKPLENLPNPQVTEMASGGSNKIVIYFIVGLVLIVIVVGGIYWYMNKQQIAGNTSQTGYTAPKTTAANTPTTTLDQDLNAIDVQASDSGDFNSIDQDLKSL